MNRAILLISLALPLAACGSPAVDEKNASIEEVADKVRETSDEEGLLRPGKWSTTVSIEDMEIAGLGPEAAEHMKRMVVQTHTSESCLTPEEARQPKGKFFGGGENCRYEHFTMGGGKIDAEMRCEQGGMKQVMEMAGAYSPNSYQMRMKATNEGGPGGQAMTMRMKVEANRVGNCSGKES